MWPANSTCRKAAVKQRLSRGRKVLQERMMHFVEKALTKSAPGTVFTMGVLTTIAALPAPAKAATVGATAAKVGSMFKWATIVTFLASVSGFISSFFALRANLDQSRTKRERRAVVKTTVTFVGVAVVFVAGMLGLRFLAAASYVNPGYLAFLSQVLVVSFVVGYLVLTNRLLKGMRALRTAERLRRPDLFESPVDQPGSKKREYKSCLTLLDAY
jgi:hypothetical protein